MSPSCALMAACKPDEFVQSLTIHIVSVTHFLSDLLINAESFNVIIPKIVLLFIFYVDIGFPVLKFDVVS